MEESSKEHPGYPIIYPASRKFYHDSGLGEGKAITFENPEPKYASEVIDGVSRDRKKVRPLSDP
jgi:hypothetical protein